MTSQTLRAVLAQSRMELRLMRRRGENLIVTLVLPPALLIFFASSGLGDLPGQASINFLAPGIMAMAIMSIGLVSLSIATAYERHYGVLKRLGGTPLTRANLVTAKILAVLAVEVVQLTIIVGIAMGFFGWRPAGNPVVTLLVALLGTISFASLGLALAGLLRAEAVLALANGLLLLLLFVGGFVVPIERLPPPLAAIAPWLPSGALSEALRAVTAGAPLPVSSLLVLAVWAAAATGVAATTFRWE